MAGLAFAGNNDQVETGTWTLSGVADLAPGSYLIRVTATDGLDSATADAEIIVEQENADATNTSPVFVSTDPNNPDNGVIPLQAHAHHRHESIKAIRANPFKDTVSISITSYAEHNIRTFFILA